MRRRCAYLLVVGLAALTTGCSLLRRLIRRPEVRRLRPRITGIGLRGVDLAFKLDLYNPNYLPLWAPPVRYALDVQGKEFLSGQTAAGFTLRAREVDTVTLPVRITYARLWRAYRELAGVSEAAYRLRGALVFSALDQTVKVPLTYSGKFPVLRAPKFSDIRFRLSDVSLQRAAITIEARVENPNVFEVDIQGLGYVFQLGDTRIAGLSVSAAGPIPAGKTGRVKLTGHISAAGAVGQLLKKRSQRKPRLSPTGLIKTPYGTVDLTPKP